MIHGFFGGKFMPLHKGHLAELCRRLLCGEMQGELQDGMDRFGDKVYMATYEKA